MDGRQRTAGRGCFEEVTENVFFGVRTDIYLSFFVYLSRPISVIHILL